MGLDKLGTQLGQLRHQHMVHPVMEGESWKTGGKKNSWRWQHLQLPQPVILKS